MKTKYEFTLKLDGFEPKEKNKVLKKEMHSAIGLNYEIARYQHLEVFKNPRFKKVKEFLMKLEASQSVSKFQKMNVNFKVGKQKVSLTTKEKKYNDSYSQTELYYLFHVSLRKHCEGKAAWGLWQFINAAHENKVESVLDVFFSNFIYVWRRLHEDPSLNIKKMKDDELEALAKKFKKVHFIEMEEDPSQESVTRDNRLRPFWYMLQGLYEGFPDGELATILYYLADNKLK